MPPSNPPGAEEPPREDPLNDLIDKRLEITAKPPSPIPAKPTESEVTQAPKEEPKSKFVLPTDNEPPLSAESDALKLLPLGLAGSRIASFMANYVEKLDPQMRNSFAKFETALQQMEEGYEGQYLKFENSLGDVEGVVLINMDHTS